MVTTLGSEATAPSSGVVACLMVSRSLRAVGGAVTHCTLELRGEPAEMRETTRAAAARAPLAQFFR